MGAFQRFGATLFFVGRLRTKYPLYAFAFAWAVGLLFVEFGIRRLEQRGTRRRVFEPEDASREFVVERSGAEHVQLPGLKSATAHKALSPTTAELGISNSATATSRHIEGTRKADPLSAGQRPSPNASMIVSGAVDGDIEIPTAISFDQVFSEHSKKLEMAKTKMKGKGRKKGKGKKKTNNAAKQSIEAVLGKNGVRNNESKSNVPTSFEDDEVDDEASVIETTTKPHARRQSKLRPEAQSDDMVEIGIHNQIKSESRVLPKDGRSPAAWFQTIRNDFQHLKAQVHLEQIRLEDAVQAGRAYTAWDRRRWLSVGTLHNTSGEKVRSGSVAIKEIWVWGERRSCADLLVGSLNQAFGKSLDCGRADCVLRAGPWADDFPSRRVKDRDQSTLHVLVTADPYRWLTAMQDDPQYSALHSNMEMEDLLTTEWAGFGRDRQDYYVRDYTAFSTEATKVHHAPYREQDLIRECVADPATVLATPAEKCSYGGAIYQCTAVPGIRVTVGNEEAPAADCLDGARSRPHCLTRFLCKTNSVSNSTLPWQSSPSSWADRLEQMVYAAVNRSGVPSCAVLEAASHRLHRIGCRIVPSEAKFFKCLHTNVLQNREDDDSGSEHCLPGRYSWKRCRQGKFWCNARTPDLFPAADDTEAEQAYAKEEAKRVRGAFLDADAARIPLVGEWSVGEVHYDRDPMTGHRFPNLVALRTAKLQDWRQEARHMPFSRHVQCQQLAQPLKLTELLREMADAFRLRAPDAATIATECNGAVCVGDAGTVVVSAERRRAVTEGNRLRGFNRDTLGIVAAWLDPEVEAAFGYEVEPMAGRDGQEAAKAEKTKPSTSGSTLQV